MKTLSGQIKLQTTSAKPSHKVLIVFKVAKLARQARESTVEAEVCVLEIVKELG